MVSSGKGFRSFSIPLLGLHLSPVSETAPPRDGELRHPNETFAELDQMTGVIDEDLARAV